jgi:hypothetical protein
VPDDQKILKSAGRLADLIFAVTALACLMVLSYFVYYYGWTGQRQFANWKGKVFYYVLPGLFAAGSLAALRLPNLIKINAALLLLSGGASIAIAETSLTVWFNLPSVNLDALVHKRMEAATAAGIRWDTRSKTEVVEDFRRQGEDAVPALFPQGLLEKQQDGTLKSVIRINGSEVLPLAGISNRLTVVCNEAGEYVSYRSDEHGFNNPQRTWDRPLIDMAAVGDSYVYLWCVPPEKHFVSLIRSRMPGVLNLGMEGNGPLSTLATIKEYASTSRPKLVLWFFFEGNDLADLERERMAPLLLRYLDTGFNQRLIERQPELDTALNNFVASAGEGSSDLRIKLGEAADLIRNAGQTPGMLRSIVRLQQLRQRLGLAAGQDSQGTVETVSSPDVAVQPGLSSVMELFQRVLSEAGSTVNGWGGRLYFVYLPAWHRYAPGQFPNTGRDAVLRIAKLAGIPIIDFHEAIRSQQDPLSLFHFRLQSHYTEAGNRMLADYVMRSIDPFAPTQ